MRILLTILGVLIGLLFVLLGACATLVMIGPDPDVAMFGVPMVAVGVSQIYLACRRPPPPPAP